MHANFDQVENFEALLASEFESGPQVRARQGEDYYDAGYRVVNILAMDIALEDSILDLEELG